MQSSAPHVLRVLDRQHQPGRPEKCVQWAREAGFDHVSLDLIYGTPGESDDDWRRSITDALGAGPDHISGYALIVEEGTRLAARVRRGEITPPDDDAMADRYLIADDMLGAAGFTWYEVSNWAKSDQARCRHNMLYWTGGDWWGFGPGAHSHVGATRWWNVRHPASYASRLAAGQSPAQAREVLTAAEQRMEEIMLRARLADGLPLSVLGGAASQQRWKNALGPLRVLWVGVRCDAAVAAGRELARGDRVTGMAASQAEVVHRGVVYDLQVDTTHTEALACAQAIASPRTSKATASSTSRTPTGG